MCEYRMEATKMELSFPNNKCFLNMGNQAGYHIIHCILVSPCILVMLLLNYKCGHVIN